MHNFRNRYPNSFNLFVWLGTCNYCEVNAQNHLILRDNIAKMSAEIVLNLGRIVHLGIEKKIQFILLEVPVICTQEWNRVHGHPSRL